MGKIVDIKSSPTVAGAAENLAAWPEAYLVYDGQVAPLAGELIEAVPNIRASLGLDISEAGKTMDTVLHICRFLLDAGASRKALLIALGGGITSDMAGFAACIYKRGIEFAFIPTTLLAQVDAAIGGKTGVNFDDYKNMLGIIRQPVFTLLSPEPLETLDDRDFRCGVAEMLKTFLIDDADLYREAVTQLQHPSADRLQPLIFAAATIKADIVSRDPDEHGERRILNFGHTFAHAIEHEARTRGDDLAHGEAVAIGMILAARLSERLGIAQKGLAARLTADFEACGLPVECPYPLDGLIAAMARDKKAEGGIIHFILIASPGHIVEKDLAAEEAIRLLS